MVWVIWDEEEVEINNLAAGGDVVVEGEEKEEVEPVQEMGRCLSLWLSMNIINSLCDRSWDVIRRNSPSRDHITTYYRVTNISLKGV
ncbi:hypothetical protein C5167_015265 [Papaver somniferum]|uniref:Uncharacterized protein n=1 Tax=Papaver somniferum TaxID=3469 RepID=A0A4Y7J9L2_PAPSO|nr:hypothetical protein C5167_015265 [Papaver somniferum]